MAMYFGFSSLHLYEPVVVLGVGALVGGYHDFPVYRVSYQG